LKLFSRHIFILSISIFFGNFLGAQSSEKNWFYKTIVRIESSDTVGIHLEIQQHIVNSSNNNANLLLDEMAATEFFLSANKYDQALSELNKSKQLDSILQVDSLKGMLNCLEGFYFYYAKENYPIAIDFLNKAALDFNNTAQSLFQARCYSVRALILQSLNYPNDAEKNMLIALSFYHKGKTIKREAAILNNLGIVCIQLKDSAKASSYLFRSLAIRDSIGDIAYEGQCYNNLGALMYDCKHYEAALDYYMKGFEYRTTGHAPQNGIIESYINIGKTYRKLGNQDQALVFLQHAYDATDDTTRLELRSRASKELMGIYFEMKDYKRAYEMQSKYYYAQDVLYGQAKKEDIVRLTVQYGFENKQKQDSLRRVEQEIAKNGIQQEKEKRTNIILISLLVGLALAGFFVFSLYKSNQQKKRSNEIISTQRDTLDKKQQEITESIRYAQYIQEALLPDQDTLNNSISDYFILYKPKDIVSGDFYWFNSLNAESFLLAVADCTGHGVPGAFMSLLGKENLDKVSAHSNRPGEILSLLNRSVKQSLQQNRTNQNITGTFSATEIKDGMDIALLKIEKQKDKTIAIYAGANRPLWILRKNGSAIEEIKSTKSAIGGFTSDEQKFEETKLELSSGDIIYLSTDGFADQFGGDRQKKLTTKKFREYLFEISNLQMKEQKEKLEKLFVDWKGNLEQVDDILIIGIKMECS
jgi:serine phosphatase RsbU (regulator of sigma subunit)